MQEFSFKGMLGFAQHGPASTGQVKIRFNDGQELTCSQKFLEDMVQKDFDSRIFVWSSVVFLLGLVDGIWGLFLKYSAQSNACPHSFSRGA